MAPSSRRDRCPRLAGLALALLATGCQKPAPPPAPVPPGVFAKPVVKSDGARELRLSGSLAAERSIALSFATLGTVAEVKVREGQAVTRGQLLAVIAPQSYRDALGIAESKAKQADDAYQRLQPMYQNKTLPEIKMVEVEAGRKQAQLSVSMARKSLKDTALRAPVAGIVASRSIEPGMSATPGFPAFTIVQTKTMMATAPVPETQVSRLKRGTTARVTIPAIGKTLDGEVQEIAVAANPLTRTYDVKVALPNPAGELRVGMIATINLKVGEGGGELVVPPEAVRIDEAGANFVFVVGADQHLQRRSVKVAGFVGEDTAVAEGVREGEQVVTSGTPMLADGLTVRLLNASARKATP